MGGLLDTLLSSKIMGLHFHLYRDYNHNICEILKLDSHHMSDLKWPVLFMVLLY